MDGDNEMNQRSRTSQLSSTSPAYGEGVEFGACCQVQGMSQLNFYFSISAHCMQQTKPTTELESSVDKLLKLAKL